MNYYHIHFIFNGFPFHNNPQLEYAAYHACKTDGSFVFLSATPPTHLQRQVRTNELPCVKVPVRYHRHPLPVPRLVRTKLLPFSQRTGFSPSLERALRATLDRGAQAFLFVPKIALVEPLQQQLRQRFPETSIAGTSSKDSARGEKVTAFRQGAIRLLVTTTILERGVTVPKTDVFVLGADSPMFDEASLIQMAGRAGRSADDPNGHVYFCAPEKTVSQIGAIRQIKRMNKLARQKGYLMGAGGSNI